jgi:8-oxo-dGTP pyrophosphatase MutT (NUDIX family)
MLTRDFVVAIFVVWQNQVLLHTHPKLGLVLPPGGHIEKNELPDEAALRETLEETGLQIELIGELAPHGPEANAAKPLIRPRGVQLEQISFGHEHIDLIYFARPLEPKALLEPFFWADVASLQTLPISLEVRQWCELAVKELGSRDTSFLEPKGFI